MKFSHIIFVATIIATPATGSALAADLPQALLDCARHVDDTQRLGCYDEQVAALADNKKPADKVAETEKTPEAELASPEAKSAPSVDQFGMTEKLARELGIAEDRQTPASIAGTIVALHEKPRGRRVVHLDNGQVWEEKSRTPHMKLEVGSRVTIKEGALGSYNLSSESSNRFTKVQRVK